MYPIGFMGRRKKTLRSPDNKRHSTVEFGSATIEILTTNLEKNNINLIKLQNKLLEGSVRGFFFEIRAFQFIPDRRYFYGFKSPALASRVFLVFVSRSRYPRRSRK